MVNSVAYLPFLQGGWDCEGKHILMDSKALGSYSGKMDLETKICVRVWVPSSPMVPTGSWESRGQKWQAGPCPACEYNGDSPRRDNLSQLSFIPEYRRQDWVQ